MKAATKMNSMVRPRLSFVDHAGAVARRDDGKAGDGDLIARMLGAHRVERSCRAN